MDSTSIKALRALEWMCFRDTPTGVTEMAIALGMGKSNAHRVLSTLVVMGYVRALEDGRYSPSLKTWELGCALIEQLDFKYLARPFMEQLSEETSETVHLSILDRLDVVYVDKVESNQPVRAYSRIGGRAPAYTVATGKALLAFQKGLAELLPEKLPAHTELTLVDRESVLAEFAEVRERGYAINRGEWRDSVCGVAAPIRNERGEVIAAMGISGPASRLALLKLELLGPKVIESADKVSFELGYRKQQTRRPSIGITKTEPAPVSRKSAARKTAKGQK